MGKPWYQSKTIWTNFVAIIAGIGTVVQTGDYTALATSGLGAVNILLRVISGAPIE